MFTKLVIPILLDSLAIRQTFVSSFSALVAKRTFIDPFRTSMLINHGRPEIINKAEVQLIQATNAVGYA